MRDNGGEAVGLEARADLAAVENDPEARLRFAARFYREADDGRVLNFGESELAFMRWEQRRGVLNPPDDAQQPGSAWWRTVNGDLLVNAQEAYLRRARGCEAGASPAVAAWLRFLDEPAAVTWYRAHNTSVVRGYIAHADLATREDGWEQKLMNIVLYRVLFTQAVVDRERWADLGLTKIAAALCDPRSKLVPRVVKEHALYPDSYPLDARDRARLERRFDHFGSVPVAFIDLVFIRTRLDRLYAFMAADLGVEELARFCQDRLTTYPWCFDVNDNELTAIEIADHPGWPTRALGWLMDAL